MPEHTSGAPADVDASTPPAEQTGQPSWAGAMAQIDAEIKELQEMLARRRRESLADLEDAETDPDSVA